MKVADGARVQCPHCHKPFVIEFRHPKRPETLPKQPSWKPRVEDKNPKASFLSA